MAFRCCRKRYEPHEDLDVEDVENQYRAGRKESLNLPKDFPMYVISVEDFLELDEMRLEFFRLLACGCQHRATWHDSWSLRLSSKEAKESIGAIDPS